MKVYRTGVSVAEVKVSPTTVIQGRIVNQSRSYQLSFCKKKNKQDNYYVEGNIVWQRVKGVINTNENQDVYNIEVEEDNSYTANGVIVHNCQSFSFAGKMKGMSTTTNERITTLPQYLKLKEDGFEFEGQSYLFWEFVRILKETKPTYFFLENVVMEKKWERIITNALGVEPILVDAALVSAQSRKRLFWTNINITAQQQFDMFGNPIPQIPNIKLPKDRGILLKHILQENVNEKYYLSKERVEFFTKNSKKLKEKGIGYSFTLKDPNSKSFTITTKEGNRMENNFIRHEIAIRRLTPLECRRLQTIPDWYKFDCSDSQIYKMLGNGWCIQQIMIFWQYLK